MKRTHSTSLISTLIICLGIILGVFILKFSSTYYNYDIDIHHHKKINWSMLISHIR